MDHPLAADLDHVLEHTEPLWSEVRAERIFVTGGTGFVGTWLSESLVWANRRLALDIRAVLLTRNPQAFHSRAPQVAGDPSVTLCTGNAREFSFPEGTFPLVVHAATERYFTPGPDHPAGTFDLDLAATRRVLELARSRGARRLLFTSSGAVYGKQPPELEHVPEDYPGAPAPSDVTAAYGHGKRVSEYLCSAHGQAYGFSATIGRLFAFIGPHLPLDEGYAAGNFLRDAMAGGPLRIAGDGTSLRSYLHAADMAIWLWTILLRGAANRPYNVGSWHAVSIAELARTMVREVAPHAEVKIAREPVPGAPAARYVPATDRAEKELGLAVRIPLADAIRRTHAWHQGKSSR
jgi:dTDP-glucose 4,6-dehydratase